MHAHLFPSVAGREEFSSEAGPLLEDVFLPLSAQSPAAHASCGDLLSRMPGRLQPGVQQSALLFLCSKGALPAEDDAPLRKLLASVYEGLALQAQSFDVRSMLARRARDIASGQARVLEEEDSNHNEEKNEDGAVEIAGATHEEQAGQGKRWEEQKAQEQGARDENERREEADEQGEHEETLERQRHKRKAGDQDPHEFEGWAATDQEEREEATEQQGQEHGRDEEQPAHGPLVAATAVTQHRAGAGTEAGGTHASCGDTNPSPQPMETTMVTAANSFSARLANDRASPAIEEAGSNHHPEKGADMVAPDELSGNTTPGDVNRGEESEMDVRD